MKPTRRLDELPFRITDSPHVTDEEREEMLIADKRAGLSPADMVEQRLQALLHGSARKLGTPPFGNPRANPRARRKIDDARLGQAKETVYRRETKLGQGESSMYAISIEQSQAAEILTRLRPWPCRFWQTDHRGLLLIHARTRKAAKGASASDQGAGCNALVGIVELVDCIASAHHGDDPDEVEYHWLLANPRTFVQPLPYAGRLGLFLVSERLVAAALRQVGTSRRPRG
ncbi:MAG: hypothetical protein ACRELG_27330 [Gemmataceae bacterium]